MAENAHEHEGDHKLTDLVTAVAMASRANVDKYQLAYVDELAMPDYQHYGSISIALNE